ncbi:hypothetical protein BaRGS_00000451, partial [Batillaria attramentaria]
SVHRRVRADPLRHRGRALLRHLPPAQVKDHPQEGHPDRAGHLDGGHRGGLALRHLHGAQPHVPGPGPWRVPGLLPDGHRQSVAAGLPPRAGGGPLPCAHGHHRGLLRHHLAPPVERQGARSRRQGHPCGGRVWRVPESHRGSVDVTQKSGQDADCYCRPLRCLLPPSLHDLCSQ